MDYKKLADLLFPKIDKDIDYYLKKYPKRELAKGAEVTRIAPSPTGFLHLGTAYGALIDYFTAKKSNGIFYMRLEDTDQKREIKDAGQIAYDMLCYYDIVPDEGYCGDKDQVGEYGNYVQSKRVEIYQTFAKHLVSIGRAFPCFCEKSENKEDILQRRSEQLENADDIEAKDPCRDLSYEQIEANIKQGKPFALRLKSMGDKDKTFEFCDLIKGKRQIRENTKDIVLLKSNGIPPYSLAHLVDDTLMGTTIVVRGEEWYPSLASHLELFDAFSLPRLKYAHTPVICKLDEQGNKRKLSKRKDAEADARYFIEKGYPKRTVVEYLLNLLNSDFETWRTNNPTLDYHEFDFKISKIGSNNPMFDLTKLEDVSKNIISYYSPLQMTENTIEWAKNFDKEFYEIIKDKKEFLQSLFSIDRVNTPKPRKDVAKWSDVKQLYSYVFEQLYHLDMLKDYDFDVKFDNDTIKKVLLTYMPLYDINDEKQVWFDKIKSICEPLGFSADMKAYRKNPENFVGSVADVSGIIRVALTGRRNTPDLYYICKLIGQDSVLNRIKKVVDLL